MPEIKVLDHGHIRLFEHMGSDLSIVRNARVSYAAEWRSGTDEGKDEKLIRYLLRNRHTSPFECVSFTFDISCPIFVARQWMRHRTWSYNEVSARYTELPDKYYIPNVEHITQQSKDNKQMRTEIKLPHASTLRIMIQDSCAEAFDTYKELLRNGCPRELARGVLPTNTYTHFFGTVDLHNLFHFIKLRLHPHAQYEIRVYAQALLDLIRPVVPVSVKVFEELQLEQT